MKRLLVLLFYMHRFHKPILWTALACVAVFCFCFIVFFRGSDSKAVAVQPTIEMVAVAASTPSLPTTQRIPILVYHNIRTFLPHESVADKVYTVEPDVFRTQMQYLKDNGYTPVPMRAVSDLFEKGTALPEKPVVITLDDGWESQYTNALPVLKEFGFPATAYIYTVVIGHRRFLAWDQVREMQTQGIEIGGHTKTHAYLTRITDPAIFVDEIVESKRVTEEKIGTPITAFAYPFGLYSDAVVAAVKDAGYRTARTIRPGIVQTADALFTLHASLIQNDMKLFVAALERE